MSIDYDKLIVEIKRRYDSMNNSTIWEVPRFSNTQIVKAGKILINPSASDEEMSAALEVLNNWRSSHAYPLQVIATNLRGKNKNAIVVQRLKRLDSIIGKLRRFPNMSLYRMQDLGGCRVILPNVSDVYHSVAEYKNFGFAIFLRGKMIISPIQRLLDIEAIILFINFTVKRIQFTTRTCILRYNSALYYSMYGPQL